jgi:hypothetical protein
MDAQMGRHHEDKPRIQSSFLAYERWYSDCCLSRICCRAFGLQRLAEGVRSFAMGCAFGLGVTSAIAAALAWIRPALALLTPLIALVPILICVDLSMGPHGSEWGIDIAYVIFVAGIPAGIAITLIAAWFRRIRTNH